MTKINLSSFSAQFNDYEFDTEYYHGKDIVHEGCLLKIDTEESWLKIDSKTRKKIKKTDQLNIDIKRVSGSKRDILDFRTIWFNPEDETIPEELEENEIMYLAYKDSELIGGLILTPSSPSVLYTHNLGSSPKGKSYDLPAYLLWNAVKDLEGGEYKFIDIGVSFRPTLYRFFRKFQTHSYPIIFNPPFIKPDIRLTPLGNQHLIQYSSKIGADNSVKLKEFFGSEYTILPRGIHAIKAVMQHIGVGKKDNIALFKTFDNEYVSRCVSETIESFTTLSNEINDNTKAAFVIHEFGVPYSKTHELKKLCAERNIPLIEDCAWAIGSQFENGDTIGSVGDYAIYSLPKVLPLQYGAILKGVEINDEDNWNTYQMLDYYKRKIILSGLAKYLPTIHEANEKRRQNWQYLDLLFKQDGFDTYCSLDEGVVPGVYMVKMSNYAEVFDRMEAFGVEAGRYYHEGVLFLPVHQNLSKEELDYTYGAFRGLLNLCSEYRRK